VTSKSSFSARIERNTDLPIKPVTPVIKSLGI